MTTLACLVCADSESSGERLRKALESGGHARVEATVTDASELAAQVETRRPDAIVATFRTDAAAMLDALEQLPEPQPLIVISAPHDDSRVLLRAIRLGVKEFLPVEPAEEDVRATVVRLLRAHPDRVDRSRTPAPVISVLGARGGIGATTIACQLAATLQANAATVIVDLDLADGDVALYFDVAPHYTLSDLKARVEELDAMCVRMLLHRHASGVHILASPSRAEQVDLVGTARLERVIEILQEEFDWVILDVSRAWRECNLRALDLSDQILLVTGFDVAAMHHTRRLIELFRQLGRIDRLRLIANRKSSDDAVGKADFRRFLERDSDARLPNDFASSLACIEQGKPIGEVARDRPIHRAYVDLAARLHEWSNVPLPERHVQPGRVSGLLRKVMRRGSS